MTKVILYKKYSEFKNVYAASSTETWKYLKMGHFCKIVTNIFLPKKTFFIKSDTLNSVP